MLQLWIVSNKYWKVRYGSRERAYRSVMENMQDRLGLLYPMDLAGGWKIQEEDAAGLEIGAAIRIFDYRVGPPWHRSLLQVFPQSCIETPRHMIPNLRAGQNMKFYRLKAVVVKIFMCHDECERFEEEALDTWPEIIRDLAVRLYGLKYPLTIRSDTYRSRWPPIVINEKGELVWEDKVELKRVMDSADQVASFEPELKDGIEVTRREGTIGM